MGFKPLPMNFQRHVVIILFPKSFLRILVIAKSHLAIQNMLLARSSVLQEFLVQIFQMGGREVLLGHFTSNQGSSLAKDNHKGHLLCFPGLAQSFLSKVRKSLLKSNQLLSNSQSRINAFPFSGINPNILFLQPRSTKDHIMNNQFIGL